MRHAEPGKNVRHPEACHWSPAMLSMRTLLATTAAAALASVPAHADHLDAQQMEAAAHVYTGVAQCEFGQQVKLTPVEGHAGHFRLEFKRASYDVVPEVTTTGAVRLEDKRAGMVWIQIPTKSMLLNARRGQREADECLNAQQRSVTATAAVQ